VATALARESRNRRAGELLAAGVPASEIPALIGQAVEALQSVPLLAQALERAGAEDAGTERSGAEGAGTERAGTERSGTESAGGESRAPITSALGRLISGELPLAEWVALVRTTVPPPARWRRREVTGAKGFWRRLWLRVRRTPRER
jgi:glycerol-3-phosphate dehydrogenase (NAD(P)+)